jgi:hypothetical protein
MECNVTEEAATHNEAEDADFLLDDTLCTRISVNLAADLARLHMLTRDGWLNLGEWLPSQDGKPIF